MYFCLKKILLTHFHRLKGFQMRCEALSIFQIEHTESILLHIYIYDAYDVREMRTNKFHL